MTTPVPSDRAVRVHRNAWVFKRQIIDFDKVRAVCASPTFIRRATDYYSDPEQSCCRVCDGCGTTSLLSFFVNPQAPDIDVCPCCLVEFQIFASCSFDMSDIVARQLGATVAAPLVDPRFLADGRSQGHEVCANCRQVVISCFSDGAATQCLCPACHVLSVEGTFFTSNVEHDTDHLVELMQSQYSPMVRVLLEWDGNTETLLPLLRVYQSEAEQDDGGDNCGAPSA